LGCSTTVKGVGIGGIGLTVRSTSLSALEVFFTVFLSALALLLCTMALTKIRNNIGFKWLQKIGDGDIIVWRMGGGMREYRKRV
jgi:hypothetical protein